MNKSIKAVLLCMTFSMMLQCNPAFAQEEYVKVSNSDCLVWGNAGGTKGTTDYQWQGDCTDGKVSGHGTLVSTSMRNGEKQIHRYVGDMHAGKREGNGTYTFPDDSVYQGEWKNGLWHGKGQYTGVDRSKREGEWLEGLLVSGVSVTSNGDKYVGSMNNGKKNGRGTFYQADGRIENGVWEDNALKAIKHGELLIWKDGEITNTNSVIENFRLPEAACTLPEIPAGQSVNDENTVDEQLRERMREVFDNNVKCHTDLQKKRFDAVGELVTDELGGNWIYNGRSYRWDTMHCRCNDQIRILYDKILADVKKANDDLIAFADYYGL